MQRYQLYGFGRSFRGADRAVPAQGVTDVNACLRNEFNSYPALSFYNALGPNSNTFAGVLARRCCAGMTVKPAALGTVPGWNYPPAKYRPGICPKGGPNCYP